MRGPNRSKGAWLFLCGVYVAALSILDAALSRTAMACSLVNVAESMAESVEISYDYWIASVVLGALAIFFEFRAKRPSLIMVVIAMALILHPAWTVRPYYGPDCTFQNVEASQLVLAMIVLLLAYQVFRLVRGQMRLKQNEAQ